jgi:transposase
MEPIHLAPTERRALLEISSTTHDARILRRAQSLLWVDNGEPVEAAARRQNIPRQSIYYWIHRFRDVSENNGVLSRLTDAPRSGRPAKIKGVVEPILENVIDKDPRSFGYAHTNWTADLLVHYLENHHSILCSEDSVRKALHRIGIVWKAPRYRLRRRPLTWRQKKGA